MFKKGGSVLALVDAEKAVGMEMIARSAFENYIDLINLFKHRPEYLQYVKYMSSAQQVRSIENLIKNRQSSFSVPIIRSMPERLEITIEQSLEMTKEEKIQFRSRLSRVYTDDNKPISDPRSRINTSVRLRSELAGQQDKYESLYRSLSKSTHSDFMSMLKGVFKDGGYVWPPDPPQPSLLVIDAVTMMLHETTEMLAKKNASGFTRRFSDITITRSRRISSADGRGVPCIRVRRLIFGSIRKNTQAKFASKVLQAG